MDFIGQKRCLNLDVVGLHLQSYMIERKKLGICLNTGIQMKLKDEQVDQSRRFKSSLTGSDGGFDCCASKRKLPGHIKSNASSNMKDGHPGAHPILWSLNLATIAVPSLLGLCTREWGLTPSERMIGAFVCEPNIVIILWDWYLLAAPSLSYGHSGDLLRLVSCKISSYRSYKKNFGWSWPRLRFRVSSCWSWICSQAQIEPLFLIVSFIFLLVIVTGIQSILPFIDGQNLVFFFEDHP